MKTCYSHHCSPTAIAVVDLCRCSHPQGYAITEVYVPANYRQQGIATRLMEEVIEDAELEEETLALRVAPYGDGLMEVEQLEDWYARLGFRRSGRGDYMVRFPGQDE